ncbi:MAG: hypothetical protein RBT59_11700 [Arcobacteraceae bacterium]|jgi:hypothetical protein|nr:hypothetical protein [Arcobacteraceae bacterium]
MNPFIYDLRYLKYRFIQAYFHFQLLEAQRLTDEGQGIECVTDASIIGDAINKIMIIIDKNNNTFEFVENAK